MLALSIPEPENYVGSSFINPAWHVMLVHFPLGLLVTGIVLEVFVGRCCASLRSAARWMILLGALAAVPTVTSGIAAFHMAAVQSTSLTNEPTWTEVVAASSWKSEQWATMADHIKLTSIATGIFLIAVVIWLGCSDVRRRQLHGIFALIMLLGLVLVGAGAWHAGEAIFRQGVAVVPTAGSGSIWGPPGFSDKLLYFLPPLQLHLVLAGCAVAIAAAAIGVMLRRWSQELPDMPESGAAPVTGQDLSAALDPNHTSRSMSPSSGGSCGGLREACSPAGFWLLAAVLVIVTVVAGLWLFGPWRPADVKTILQADRSSGNLRRSVHALLGSGILVLLLLLAILARWARDAKWIALLFTLLLGLAVAAQIGVGVLLTYDTEAGALTHFNKPVAASAHP
jgi:uncharacterized membrane protein